MASVPGLFATVTRTPLLEAGFWNYLREDITFSLFERCPLKMGLETSQPLLDLHSDQGHLNAITLVLGRIINDCFRDEADNLTWSNSFDSLCEWHQQLPAHMLPYSRQNSSTPFPTIWLLQPCHGMSADMAQYGSFVTSNSIGITLLPRWSTHSGDIRFGSRGKAFIVPEYLSA
jgi:hypothetical protein